MTDRIKGLLVTLDRDYREDDVQGIIDAISHICGVAHVGKSVSNVDDHFNRQRIDAEWRERLIALIQRSRDKSE